MEHKNNLEKNHLDTVHHILDLQESIEAKIDAYTKELQSVKEQYNKTEKKIAQFGSRNINYVALTKTVVFVLLGLYPFFYLARLLLFSKDVPHIVTTLFFVCIYIILVVAAYRAFQKSFVPYKYTLEQQAMHYKNNMQQLQKNIDNRIRELHEVQQRLQQLWGNKNHE